MRQEQIPNWLNELITKTALDATMPTGQTDVNETVKNCLPSGNAGDEPDPEDIEIEFEQDDKKQDEEKADTINDEEKDEDSGDQDSTKPDESSEQDTSDVTSTDQLQNQLKELQNQVKKLKTDEGLNKQLEELKKQIERIEVPDRNPDMNSSLFQSASIKIKHSRRVLRRICANHLKKKAYFNTKQIELMENFTRAYPELGYNQLSNLISKDLFLNPHEIYFYLLSRPQKGEAQFNPSTN
jgi:hypothetical protein